MALTGTIETIYIATHPAEIQTSLKRATLHTGLGILGDRWYASTQGHRGQNITLIAAEEIDRYNQTYHQTIKYDATRRNIVTRGINLNDLVGKTFSLGSATLHGVDLCEPCRMLGTNLANDTITIPDVVKAFVHRGGLRADIISSGDIQVGDKIEVQ